MDSETGCVVALFAVIIIALFAAIIVDMHDDDFYHACLYSRNKFTSDSSMFAVLPKCKPIIATVDSGARK